MSPEIVVDVCNQLRAFGQERGMMEIIVVLDALHNAGYAIHSKRKLKCGDEWGDA